MQTVGNLTSYLDNSIILSPSVKLLENSDGMVFQAKGSACLLRGDSSYQLATWLYNKLDGSYTVADILPTNSNFQERILSILEYLLQKSIAELSKEKYAEIDKTLVRDNLSLFHYLRNYTVFPIQAMRVFFQQQFVCIASGIFLNSIISALKNYGVKEIAYLEKQQEVKECVASHYLDYHEVDLKKPIVVFISPQAQLPKRFLEPSADIKELILLQMLSDDDQLRCLYRSYQNSRQVFYQIIDTHLQKNNIDITVISATIQHLLTFNLQQLAGKPSTNIKQNQNAVNFNHNTLKAETVNEE